MSDGWVRTYDLARDREYIERVQTASALGSELGLGREYGLFASAEWWKAVGDGRIRTTRQQGRISRVFVGAGGWPEFELLSEGSERSVWALEGDATLYRAGRRARVDFVAQPYARPRKDGDREARVVTGIWVERTS